jgi:hypothetical protein
MEPTALVTGVADPLIQLLVRQENLYLMAAVYAFLEVVQRILPPKVTKNKIYVRLLPLYPIILCSAGVWTPGQQPADMSAVSKVLVGIILGYACAHSYKFWKQTIRGRDERLPGAQPGPTP